MFSAGGAAAGSVPLQIIMCHGKYPLEYNRKDSLFSQELPLSSTTATVPLTAKLVMELTLVRTCLKAGDSVGSLAIFGPTSEFDDAAWRAHCRTYFAWESIFELNDP